MLYEDEGIIGEMSGLQSQDLISDLRNHDIFPHGAAQYQGHQIFTSFDPERLIVQHI